jgi:hypothetical protein
VDESYLPLPDDHDVLSFLTFSLSEPGPEVMPTLIHLGPLSPQMLLPSVTVSSDILFQPLSPAFYSGWAVCEPAGAGSVLPGVCHSGSE